MSAYCLARRWPRFLTLAGAVSAGFAAAAAAQEPVGEQPPAEEARQVVPSEYGILTSPGTVVFEPSIEYQHSDFNRFVAGGAVVLDTVLIGQIETTQADRDSLTAALALRAGLTDRLEIEARVPYVYRNDKTTATIANLDDNSVERSLSSSDLGDVELGLRLQLTPTRQDAPILIAGTQVRVPTGQGPFDVDRDTSGIEEELATGAGSWGVEPNLTMLVVSDPAVYYLSVGYQWNREETVDETIGSTFVESFDPGDAFRVGFGVGLALNERTSFNIGYSHDTYEETRIDTVDSARLSIGTLSFGVNYVLGTQTALNAGVAIGVTDDAPDVRLTLKVPFAFALF